MKRTALPPRTTPMPPRTTRLAPESPKRRAARVAQGKAYAAAPDAGQGYCSVCGVPGPTEHMHLYTQKQRPDLANDGRNWIVVGRYCECHRLQENNKAEFARRFPDWWRCILNRMRGLDPIGFRAFRLRYPF